MEQKNVCFVVIVGCEGKKKKKTMDKKKKMKIKRYDSCNNISWVTLRRSIPRTEDGKDNETLGKVWLQVSCQNLYILSCFLYIKFFKPGIYVCLICQETSKHFLYVIVLIYSSLSL